MQPPKLTANLMRVLWALLVFWLVSLVFAVLAFVSFALLIARTYEDLSPLTDLMFWGLSLLLSVGYAVSLFFGMRLALKERPSH